MSISNWMKSAIFIILGMELAGLLIGMSLKSVPISAIIGFGMLLPTFLISFTFWDKI